MMLSTQLQSAWSNIHRRLDEIQDRRDRDILLPEGGLLPAVFGETKQTNHKRINTLLEDLGRSMLSSPAYDGLLHIRSLDQKIAALRERERRIRNKAFSAPMSKPAYRIDIATADELRALAANCAEEIDVANREIERERRNIANELRSWGVELEPEQQDLLFSSVIGDDMLKNFIILKNAKTILEHMATHSANTTRDPIAPKRYYGTYLCFVDVLIAANHATLYTIRQTWLPRLASVTNQARSTIADASRAIKSKKFHEQQRKVFTANIDANNLTVKVGKLYRDFLTRQAKAIESRLAELSAERAASQNTYDTVTNSANLSELIQCGLHDIDALGDVILPEMRLFENFEQQREFAELSFRLAQAV